jgi:hypothetical protein
MTTYRRNPPKLMKHLKKTQKPLVLTINDKAEEALEDAEAYQRLLHIAAQADARQGIGQGREDQKDGLSCYRLLRLSLLSVIFTAAGRKHLCL